MSARSSRRPPSAPSSSSPRAPTACCISPTSPRDSVSRASTTCSAKATRSTCVWSRSTASVAASACAWPTTRTSQASRSRNSPASARAAAEAVADAPRATAPVATAASAPSVVRAATAIEGPLHPEHEITTLTTGSAGGAPGVRVITERVPSVRSVALGFWIGTGSASERDSEAGISHLLEHMLFRGTKRFGSEEIDQIFDSIGAEINAGTDKEATSLYTRVLDRHLERAFEVMGEMVFQPRFGELETEREVVLEEIAMYEDDPQDKVFDVLGEAVFGPHPLGRAVIGTAQVVGAVTREQLIAFHAARYRPQSVVIAAAGSLEHEAHVDLARTLDATL